MIDVITISDMHGHEHHHPCVQFDLNRDHRFLLIGGVDPDMMGFIEVTDKPGFKSTYIGTLDEQGYVMQMMLMNSLTQIGWDFKTFRNPIIFIIQIIETQCST